MDQSLMMYMCIVHTFILHMCNMHMYFLHKRSFRS